MPVETKSMISVIVPVYNIKDYIEECIVSLAAQTYRDLEIILVDDGSTDGSGEICDKYVELDDRIVVLHKENGGLSDARNYGIERAKGSLLAFVDGDDWIHPQMYELMRNVMRTWQADVVTCWFERADEKFAKRQYGQNELHVKALTGSDALSDIETPLVVAWNKLYKREIFENIRYPKGKLHEDEYVIHRIFYQCKRVMVIDEPLYFYRVRNDSIVAQMTPARIENTLEALADRVEFADHMNWTEVMPAVIKRYCDYCIDRYQNIKSRRYELIDTAYLDKLWRAERDMLQKYPQAETVEQYRQFAEAPEKYDKWLSSVEKKEECRRLIRRGLEKTVELINEIYKIYTMLKLRIKSRIFPSKETTILEKMLKKKGYGSGTRDNVVWDILEEKGNFSFWIYNMMLSRMLFCEYKGYPYMLHITAFQEGYNLWNAFFEKRGIEETEIPKGARIEKVDLATPVDFHLERMNVRDKRQRKILHVIGEKYAKLNEKTKRYIDDEYTELLSGRKVLGVLYRGTDYVKLRPPGHPVQPTLDQLAQVCRKRIAKQGYRYIYITTDEKKAVDYFIKEFPDCEILTNKRNYFDEFYEEPTTKDIAACRHDRENDQYLTALEYLSSVHLLSRCDELVAGNCGGSREAIVINGGKYKYVKLFDLGNY